MMLHRIWHHARCRVIYVAAIVVLYFPTMWIVERHL